MSTWADVDKKQGGTGAGRFLQFPEGDGSVLIRVLDEEPFTTRVHKITQMVRKGDKVEEVFRSIAATPNPDDNYILKNNPKRYPDAMQFSLRVHQYKSEGGKFIDDGEVKILQGGPAIFKPLRQLYTDHGKLDKFDITITRKGKGRDTEYTVSAAPFSKNINVAAIQAAVDADPTWKWENVFVPITAVEQQKIITEAGFDIMYDPAAKIALEMSLDQALSSKMTFGKYKDKTVGEIQIIDAGYLTWAADNITSNDGLAAACRVAVSKIGEVARSVEPTRQALPPTSPDPKPGATPPPAPAAKPAAPATDDKRAGLVEGISEILESNPAYNDMSVVIELVKKHGAGQMQLKKLTTDQLGNLYRELVSGG